MVCNASMLHSILFIMLWPLRCSVKRDLMVHQSCICFLSCAAVSGEFYQEGFDDLHCSNIAF